MQSSRKYFDAVETLKLLSRYLVPAIFPVKPRSAMNGGEFTRVAKECATKSVTALGWSLEASSHNRSSLLHTPSVLSPATNVLMAASRISLIEPPLDATCRAHR